MDFSSIGESEPKWGSWVNPRLPEILHRRVLLAAQAKKSTALQAAIKLKCQQDILTFVNDWCWTADPRNLDYGKPANVPFVLFKRQEQYLLWRQDRRRNREGGLIEKSRDQGLTWLNVVAQTHAFLFEPGYKGTFASRKEMLVDQLGNLDAIFPKIRFILQSLPPWMLPDSQVEDNYMRLINPSMGSAITGEAGDQIGRGGRSSVIDIDEAAFLDHPEMIDAAVSQSTKVVFYTSTPNGIGGPFYTKRHGGKWKVFTFNWRDDPRKDDAWYERMVNTLDAVTVAQEIDISYEASLSGIMIPSLWVRAAIEYGQKLPDDIRFEPRQAGFDVAGEGSAESVLVLAQGCLVENIHSWNGFHSTDSANEARRILHEARIPHVNFDVIGVGDGVAGTFKTFAKSQNLNFSFSPLIGNASASELFWPGENRKSNQKFLNLRAEAWYLTRDRFKKTYEVVQGIREHSWKELISIPNDPELIAQLSSPLMFNTADGKIKVESKLEMKKRGIKSPDRADALVYAMYPRQGQEEHLVRPVNWGGMTGKRGQGLNSSIRSKL